MESFEDKLVKPRGKLTAKQQKEFKLGKQKEKIKKEKHIISQTKARQRKERAERVSVLNEQKEIEIYNKLMVKGNAKINEFSTIKYKYLAQAESIEDYHDLKHVFDQITEEDVLSGRHIEKLQSGLDDLTPQELEDIEEELDEELLLEKEEECSESNPETQNPLVQITDPRDI
tara:strand:+ start:243 stop:761 length:519 start_codon:yes stop_codon:yes gene_type:complete